MQLSLYEKSEYFTNTVFVSVKAGNGLSQRHGYMTYRVSPAPEAALPAPVALHAEDSKTLTPTDVVIP
jgi:hypothetical protein